MTTGQERSINKMKKKMITMVSFSMVIVMI